MEIIVADDQSMDLAHVLDHMFSSNAISSDTLQDVLVREKPSVKSLTKLLRFLRITDPHHLTIHPQIFEILKSMLIADSPPSVRFPGDSKSYVQLPSINLAGCQEAYTLSLWIRLNAGCSNKQRVSLFRCRSPQGGVECILSEHQGDGRCVLTAQVYSDGASRGHINERIVGKIFLSKEEWHLLSFTQCNSMHSKSQFRCFVDGDMEMEHELAYPFQQCPLESLWSFGAGLFGDISSMVLYGTCIPPHLLKLCSESGPLMPSLDTGVTHPQGSFDTGYSVLGTQLTKGQVALQACHAQPIFVFTANNFAPHSLLPFTRIGKVNVEHIEMISNFQEPDMDKVPFVAGNCTIITAVSWNQVWLQIGGPSVLLYLIWTYAQNGFPSSKEQSEYDPQSARVMQQACFECIIKAIELLEILLTLSGDAKDFFLQEHGFHILASSLTIIEDKHIFDENLVDHCVSLVQG